jgi:hypothetical protein
VVAAAVVNVAWVSFHVAVAVLAVVGLGAEASFVQSQTDLPRKTSMTDFHCDDVS